MYVWALLVMGVSTAICVTVAWKRRADLGLWFVMGLVLGPIAVPFVFFAEPEEFPKRQHS
jgi:hypothetical protein